MGLLYLFCAVALLNAQPAEETPTATPEALALPLREVVLPDLERITLEAYAQIEPIPITESSGLVRSRTYPHVWWTHNDSGDEPLLYPIHRDGTEIKPSWWRGEYMGIRVGDGVNIDWEGIALTDDGYLVVGAVGNNGNARRDLALYFVPEPNPENVIATRSRRLVQVHYPDQTVYPPMQRNFDCEAIISAHGEIYLLTKHRSDRYTKLYRLDGQEPHVSNPLTLLSRFHTRGMVTGADATPDGQRLAVLTYNNVWVFEQTDGTADWFNGRVWWLPIDAEQCEAIAWEDDDTFIISNEQRGLFELSMDDLIEVADPVVAAGGSE